MTIEFNISQELNTFQVGWEELNQIEKKQWTPIQSHFGF